MEITQSPLLPRPLSAFWPSGSRTLVLRRGQRGATFFEVMQPRPTIIAAVRCTAERYARCEPFGPMTPGRPSPPGLKGPKQILNLFFTINFDETNMF